MKTLFQEHSQVDSAPPNKNQIEPISRDEELARFIFSGKQLNNNGSVKAAAFLPSNSSLKTSVFRKSRMSLVEYNDKKIAVARAREKPIKAVALISVSSVFDAKLQVEPEETEHKWHADIINWPENKDERKSIAQALAKAACLEQLQI